MILKEFDKKKILLEDDNGKKYSLTADGDDEFDRDIVEDILDWEYRMRKKDECNS